MEDGREWLDPQTLEMLHREPPVQDAPARLPDFSLILLEAAGNQERMRRAVRRINDCSDSDARELLARPLPLVVNADLSFHDAALGQFELVCCDAIAVLLASRVAARAEEPYLKQLFARLHRSDEFRDVTLRVGYVPGTEEGRRFLDQFLGLVGVEAETQQFPTDMHMYYKKARIMVHWAARIGAEVRIMGGSPNGADSNSEIERPL